MARFDKSNRPRFTFGYDANTARAGDQYAQQLMDEEGYSWNDASYIAAVEIDGASDEGLTVESIQTCKDLFGESIRGVSGDDSVKKRQDPFLRSEKRRDFLASIGVDEGGDFLLKDSEDRGREAFVQLHGRKLIQAALALGLAEEFELSHSHLIDREFMSTFNWKALQNTVKEKLGLTTTQNIRE